MYKRKDGTTQEMWITNSDPGWKCGNLEIGAKLTPICFITVVKSLSYNLLATEKTIDPKTIMYNPDSRSILDNKYPTSIKNRTTVPGWGHVTQRTIFKVLNELYWYNKHRTGRNTFKLDKGVSDAIARVGWQKFKVSLKQTLHTINGMLIKKFFALGPELVGYKQLADQTARLFKALLKEYTVDRRSDLGYTDSLYEDIKDFFNYVKEWHEHKNLKVRLSILNYEFKHEALGGFFGREFRTLTATIERQKNESLGDYTQSFAWDWRCVTMAQTRNVGYVPLFKKRENTKDFQETISRKQAPLSEQRRRLIQELVVKELAAAGLPRGYNSDNKLDLNEIVEQSIHMELKPSADINFTASMGGTVEEARLALRKIKVHEWKIPIRNLVDFGIIGYTTTIRDNITIEENVYNLSSILFWYSLQSAINYAVAKGIWNKKDYYPFLLKGQDPDNPRSYEIIDNFIDAQILDIDEGGKCRKLVKNHAYFNWMLAPASKISQKVLARMPDHTAGLEAGAHDWVFTKRIGGTSDESGFLYGKNGKVKAESIFGYMDWTEATDKMWKRIGIAHLNAFFQYIRFPRIYGIFVMLMIREPQRVKEIHQVTLTPDGMQKDIIQWNGYIREGFMMGNRMTKSILHLAHTTERSFAQTFLEQEGITTLRGTPNISTGTTRIPYKSEDPKGSFHVV